MDFASNETELLPDCIDLILVDGVNINDEKCIFAIPENSLYIEDKPEKSYDEKSWKNNVISNLLDNSLYGFNSIDFMVDYNMDDSRKNKTTVVLHNAFNLKIINFPELIDSIHFYGCKYIEKIILPYGVEEFVAVHCPNLKEIIIPDTVKKLRLNRVPKIKDIFNIPIMCEKLIVDVNYLEEDAMYYIDTNDVEVILVSNDNYGL